MMAVHRNRLAPRSRNDRLRLVAEHWRDQWSFPYVPGNQDCMTLALGAADILAGTDFITRFGGSYDSPRSALRRLREAGHESLCGPLDEHFSRIPVSMARPGDVCVFAIPGEAGRAEEHYGLCLSSGFESRLPHDRHRVDPATIIAVFRVE